MGVELGAVKGASGLGAVKGVSGLGAERGVRAPSCKGRRAALARRSPGHGVSPPLALPVLELGIISPYCTLPTWKD